MTLKLAPGVPEIDPRTTGHCRGPDDALLNAVIWKLPNIGAPFPAMQRQKWLEMIAMAFDVAYGPAEDEVRYGGQAGGGMSDASPPKPIETRPVTAAPHVTAGCDYYVDEDGFARCDLRKDDAGRPFPTPKRRVLADEVDGGEVIYDYRGARRDRTTIIWADDATGSQPGMSFCGPG